MNYKKLLFLGLVVVIVNCVQAQVYTDRLVRDYKITKQSTIEVYNKYGKVHVRTWDKDSVRFEVDLRVQTSSADKLRKLKDQISFDFTSTDYYTIAKTVFTKTGGIFSDVVETLVPSNNVTINYTIFLPKTSTLKIENKFGDVYIDDFTGNLDLVLSNGNVKANYLQGNTSIKLSSGDGSVNRMDKGEVEVSYSDFELKKVGDVKIDSRSSRIEIGSANKIKMYSRRDKYYIDDVNKIYGTGDFTTLSIAKLGRELNATMKYGEVSVDKILIPFDLVNISSSYTDVQLNFGEKAIYHLDIIHNEDVFVMYSNNITGLETKEINEEEKLFNTYGLVGSKSSGTASKVKIVADKKCYLSIRNE